MIKYLNKTFVTRTICSGLTAASLFVVPSSFAGEVFTDSSFTGGMVGVDVRAVEDYNNCMQADLSNIHQSKALRSCSKALKSSVPSYGIKSDLYMRRGLLQLSSGRYDKAARDFKQAARLNADNEMAYLSEGFAAILTQDYQTALGLFEACKDNDKTAPLALYGRAISKEMTGDKQGAYADYKLAAQMRPNWQAPRTELERFRAVQSEG